ncbi:MAG: hypothetical protein A2086_11935 [Spirochaetes bacterium GWD1_27_9]|nr:MAG: hypothetical protein A2Z98_06815 [Spirochaetes bacterium GWB1_27_13]OHD22115.1 MAG: hypothetical protein A2Y34_13405 [Spirochaetes bacterium GWC1_27_15]OHD28988.1 MAG: hypothetical protein A2086_11935 [Spirochaetes bacterium GWD1_27_9]
MHKRVKTEAEQSLIERLFEGSLWNTRFVVLLAVIFGIASSLLLFIIASIDIVNIISFAISNYLKGLQIEHFYETVVGTVIGSVDMYLIAVVLLIFSFGIYEIFISQIDVAKRDKHHNLLQINNLDELKNKITNVIIMVLVVSFFQRVLSMEYKTPLDMLYLAASIFALSFGLYFLHKKNEKKSINKEEK